MFLGVSWWCLDNLIVFILNFLILYLFSWIWNKDLYTRFISKMKKVVRRFVRHIFRDSGESIQQSGRSFGTWGLWIIVLSFIGCIYWYNWGFRGWVWQLYLSNISWYYLVGLLFIGFFMWGLFKARAIYVAVHGELLGVVALLLVFFSLYLISGNIFVLLFILETQGVVLLYFIALLQMVGRSTTLGRWWVFSSKRVKQPQLWQLVALFFQFWSSFAGTVFLLWSGLRLAQIFGNISWDIIQLLGSFCRVQGWGENVYMVIVIFMVGFLVKVGLFPFHFWKPDLYKNFGGWGMMIYVTAYTYALGMLSIVLLRTYLGEFSYYWQLILFYVVLGGFLGITNILFVITEIRPFLAYMSVFHLLYVLGGLLSDWLNGGPIAVFYLYSYVLVMIHFFGVYLSIKDQKIIYLTDFQQLPRLPIFLGSITCSLVAMSGLPPFIGFWGKLGVIFSLFMHGEYALGVVSLSGGLFLLYFYFQNYRFISISQSGLLYKTLLVDYAIFFLVLLVVGGMFLNVSFSFFVIDLYGWSYLSVGWDLFV